MIKWGPVDFMKGSGVNSSLEKNPNEAVQLPQRNQNRQGCTVLLIETSDLVAEPDIASAWPEEIERRLVEIEAETGGLDAMGSCSRRIIRRVLIWLAICCLTEKNSNAATLSLS